MYLQKIQKLITMKATLEFNLSDQEDRRHHLRCVESEKLVSFIGNFEAYLRAEYKYNEELTSDQIAIVEKIRDRFYQAIQEYGLDLDELS
jgi:hypothetical protein